MPLATANYTLLTAFLLKFIFYVRKVNGKNAKGIIPVMTPFKQKTATIESDPPAAQATPPP